MQLKVITQKHQPKLPNETEATVHTEAENSHTFLQVIPILLSNGPLSLETNAFGLWIRDNFVKKEYC